MSYRARTEANRQANKALKWRITWLALDTGETGQGEHFFYFRSIAENIVAKLNEKSESRRYGVAAVLILPAPQDETGHGDMEATA